MNPNNLQNSEQNMTTNHTSPQPLSPTAQSTLPSSPTSDSEPRRVIQTFMKRKTHMGKKAEAGLQADFAHFFVQPDFLHAQPLCYRASSSLKVFRSDCSLEYSATHKFSTDVIPDL